jgi:hypothetical protein
MLDNTYCTNVYYSSTVETSGGLFIAHRSSFIVSASASRLGTNPTSRLCRRSITGTGTRHGKRTFPPVPQPGMCGIRGPARLITCAKRTATRRGRSPTCPQSSVSVSEGRLAPVSAKSAEDLGPMILRHPCTECRSSTPRGTRQKMPPEPLFAPCDTRCSFLSSPYFSRGRGVRAGKSGERSHRHALSEVVAALFDN